MTSARRRARGFAASSATFVPVLSLALSLAAPSALAAPKAAPPPASPVTIEVMPVDAARWTIRLRNSSTETSATIPVDPRLVSFELTPDADPTQKRALRPVLVRCELPPELSPPFTDVGSLSLAAGKSVSFDLDPRLYCFGIKEAEALARGGKLVAQYKSPRIVSAPIDVPEAARPAVRPGPTNDDNDDDDAAVTIVTAPRIDGVRAASTTVKVEVHNEGAVARRTFVRPGNVGFLVEGPSGAFTCPVKGAPPIAELESKLPPRGKASVDVLLGPTCAGRSFDRPGLYVVRPIFSPRKRAGSADAGIVGEHVGAPALIRIRAGVLPFSQSAPRLE